MTGQRTLALVPAPAVCAVCSDHRRVAVVALGGMRGTGPIRCPSCSARPDLPIPILTLPMRRDTPRSAA